MFGILAGLGVGVTATKFVAEFRTADPARAGRAITFCYGVAWLSGVVSAGVLLAVASPLAASLFDAPAAAPLLRISALSLLLSGWGGVQNGILAGFEAFRQSAFVTLWTGLLAFPLSVVGVYGWGVEGAIWAMVATQLAGCMLNMTILRREMRKAGVIVTWRHSAQDWRTLIGYSLPALLTGILVWPVNWVCNVILVNQPDGYVQLGLFNAANQWRTIILFVPNALAGIAFPMVSNLWGQANRTGARKTILAVLAADALIALLLAGGMSFMTNAILRIYGPAYAGGARMFGGVVISAVPISITICCGQALAALGRMWTNVLMTLAWAVLTLGLSWLWIPVYRGVGLAMTQTAAAAVLAVFLGMALRGVAWRRDESPGNPSP
jgi:O-antigen/teichoic acid export membrane protein